MKPLAISINSLSRELDVRGLVKTWLNLQSEYDLRVARRAAGERIARTVRKREAA